MGNFRKYKKSIFHFMKFAAVGVVNLGVDYGILTLLHVVAGIHIVPSNVVSYSCGVINSFFLNRYWTFKIHLKFFSEYTLKPGILFKDGARFKFISPPFMKFIFVNLLSLGVNTLTMYILVDLYSLTIYNNLIAKLIATFFSFVVNFAGSKFLVFNEKNAQIDTYVK